MRIWLATRTPLSKSSRDVVRHHAEVDLGPESRDSECQEKKNGMEHTMTNLKESGRLLPMSRYTTSLTVDIQ